MRVGVGGGGRAAAGVQAGQLAVAPDEREAVAADAGRHRLDDAQHGRGGERRVDRVAAALERPQARLRRERLAGGDHPARGDGARAGGKRPRPSGPRHLVEALEALGQRRADGRVERDLDDAEAEQRALEPHRRELDAEQLDDVLAPERRDLDSPACPRSPRSASTSPPARSRSPGRGSGRPRCAGRRSGAGRRRSRRRRAGSGPRRSRRADRARRGCGGSCSGRGSARGRSSRPSCEHLAHVLEPVAEAVDLLGHACTGRSSRASSRARRSGSSAAGCSGARRARRRRGGRRSARRRAGARART